MNDASPIMDKIFTPFFSTKPARSHDVQRASLAGGLVDDIDAVMLATSLQLDGFLDLGRAELIARADVRRRQALHRPRAPRAA